MLTCVLLKKDKKKTKYSIMVVGFILNCARTSENNNYIMFCQYEYYMWLK